MVGADVGKWEPQAERLAPIGGSASSTCTAWNVTGCAHGALGVGWHVESHHPTRFVNLPLLEATFF